MDDLLDRVRGITPATCIVVGLCLFLSVAGLTYYFGTDQNDFESGVYRILVEKRSGAGHGTGFKISSDGYVLTNEHVVDGARKIEIVYSEGQQAGKVPAKVVWLSSDKDLAILKPKKPLLGAVRQLADIGKSQQAKTLPVTAVGFPRLSDLAAEVIQRDIRDIDLVNESYLDPTVSKGFLQRFVESVEHITIQHSADISPGNSGGPLFDQCGRVIGVNTFIILEQLKYAVHISEAFGPMNEENIDYSSSSSLCRGGYVANEITAMGFVTFLGFLAFGAAFLPRSGIPLPSGGLPDPSLRQQRTFSSFLIEENTGYEFCLDALDATEPGAAKEQLIIGRLGSGSDIEVADKSVSKAHAAIGLVGGSLTVEDLDSTNGTKVDGVQVGSLIAKLLKNGSMLQVGETIFRVEIGSVRAVSSDVHVTETIDIVPSVKYFELSGFDENGKRIHTKFDTKNSLGIHNGTSITCTIGRSPENSFRLPVDAVSGRHAAIGIRSDGQIVIWDRNSTNGTFVDNDKIDDQPHILKSGAEISFAQSKFIFYAE